MASASFCSPFGALVESTTFGSPFRITAITVVAAA